MEVNLFWGVCYFVLMQTHMIILLILPIKLKSWIEIEKDQIMNQKFD